MAVCTRLPYLFYYITITREHLGRVTNLLHWDLKQSCRFYLYQKYKIKEHVKLIENRKDFTLSPMQSTGSLFDC